MRFPPGRGHYSAHRRHVTLDLSGRVDLAFNRLREDLAFPVPTSFLRHYDFGMEHGPDMSYSGPGCAGVTLLLITIGHFFD